MIQTLRSLVPLFWRHRRSYALGLACLLITNSGQLLLPQWLKAAVDAIGQPRPASEAVVHAATLIVVTALVVALARVGWRTFLAGASRRIERELRQQLADHLWTLPPDFFQKRTVGELMALATNDLEAVRNSLGMALVALTDAIFLSGSILIILFVQNPLLALIIVAPLPVITLLILGFGRLVGERFRDVQSEFGRLSQFVQEHLSGVRVVQAFRLEAAVDAKFRAANDRYRSANLRLVRLWGLYFPLISALSGLSSLLLLFFGGQAVMHRSLTLGEFTSYLSYIGMLVWPLMGAGMVVNMLQRGAASLSRIQEVLDTASLAVDPSTDRHEPATASLSIRSLTFSYPDARPALHDLSVEIPQGSFVGILGRVGSGKTTFASLLPRWLDPPPGTIFLDGRDIRTYDLETLRRQFSVVPQTPFLFSDTIKQNLAFGNPQADDERLRTMAELATISRDVETFRDGWETVVGERGVTLSGGQKQRLTLARALASDAPILILDDTLSSVDAATETAILRHLTDERAGRTHLLISHRVSALQACDWVLVLDEGRIVQRGHHDELLKQPGIYADVAALQHVAVP